MRIALAGNPNSGKTTMFNAITGRSEKVGNWAGVTVERKESKIKKSFNRSGADIVAVDLPGAYSMSPFTAEESVTSSYVRCENPDVIINIVDGTNLARSLFFTTQLLELGIPMVVALNKADVNKKRETVIDTKLLSELIGCPVVETVSTSSRGIREVIDMAVSLAGAGSEEQDASAKFDYADKETAERADRERFDLVKGIVERVESRRILSRNENAQDKLDAVLINKWLGIPIFALVMLGVFWVSQAGPGVWISDILVGYLEAGQSFVADAINSDSIWASILIDGIIGGFIAIIGFLPLVMIMYFLIALLEDSGYMARATVVLDPIFKKVGLSGKSVIPFIIGTGCAVPGVMACRTIRGERERRATAMLAPFMPCGAKLPVIALISRVFFSEAWWVGPIMYFVGILVILLGAFVINGITGFKNKRYFIMELPEYKLPSIPRAFVSMCQRGWSYIVKAGTIILVCNFVIHVMQNFGWNFMPIESASDSILATVAAPFAYVFAPIVGYVSWQLAAAAITGFIAKENVVGTLAVCFSLTNLINVENLAVEEGANVSDVALAFGTGSGGEMLAVSAIAYLMFNLFSPPCFAAIGAMNAEMKDRRWFFGGIALQLAMGYSLGFLVYFFGTIITGGSFNLAWAPILGWIIFAAILSVIVVLILKGKTKNGAESKTDLNNVAKV